MRSGGCTALCVAVAAVLPFAIAYRVVQDDYSHGGEAPRSYFEPYHPGFVNVFGDATMPRR